MNTLDITSAYLGGTQATGLYFGAVKVWPQEAPGPTSYRVTFATASISQAAIEGKLSGSSITSFQTAQGSGSNETVFYTSTQYSINSNAFSLAISTTPLLKYIDEGGCNVINGTSAFAENYLLSHIEFPALTFIAGGGFRNCRSLTTAIFPECTSIGNSAFNMSSGPGPATRLATVDMPKLISLGSSAFQSCTALTSINMPKLTTISTNAFTGALATGGTLNINSAITASANWNTSANLQRFQTQGWTINYVNN
jgi:hypothetical protein